MLNYFWIHILKYNQILRSERREVRLFYVVDGDCVIWGGANSIELGAKEIFLVNSGEDCRVEIGKEAIVTCIYLDAYTLCNILNTDEASFYVNSQGEHGYKYTELQKLIQDLLLSFTGNDSEHECRSMGIFYLLVDCLHTHFKKVITEYNEKSDQRVRQMISYVYANCREDVSLNEIAEKLFLSVSAASRLFKRGTGEFFASYVKRIRLEYVKEQLETTEESVTKIALKNGFSTPSTLNKIFRAEVGMTPGAYRKKYKKQIEVETNEAQDKKQVYQILIADQQRFIAGKSEKISIQANVEHLYKQKKWDNRLLNIGPLHALQAAAMRAQVNAMVDELNVEYIRVWHPFSKELMLYDYDHKTFNYAFVDEIIDFCVDHKMKLFFDFGPRRDVAMASENAEIYSFENSTVFESEEEWQQALRNFLHHLVRRYGLDIVSKWIFEFTFFLNDRPYYVSGAYSSIKVWNKGYQIVKECIPTAKVAGPGLVTTCDDEFTKMTVLSFLKASHAPDIFTSIHFPYLIAEEKKGDSIYGYTYRKIVDRSFLTTQIDFLNQVLEKEGFSGNHWITEWGNSLANRNYIQDSCFKGTFIVENGIQNYDKLDIMGIFYASDLINVFLDSKTILSGSGGMVSRNGIRKPAYYAFCFLNKMGKYRIMKSDNCIVTAENEMDIRILCCNNKALGPKYFLSEENSYRPDELERLFVNRDAQTMEINVLFPENDRFTVRQNILNEKKGSILNKWLAFNCAEELTRADIDYLRQTSVPEMTSEQVETTDKAIRLCFQLEPNEIRLITIQKEICN